MGIILNFGQRQRLFFVCFIPRHANHDLTSSLHQVYGIFLTLWALHCCRWSAAVERPTQTADLWPNTVRGRIIDIVLLRECIVPKERAVRRQCKAPYMFKVSCVGKHTHTHTRFYCSLLHTTTSSPHPEPTLHGTIVSQTVNSNVTACKILFGKNVYSGKSKWY